MTRAGSGKLYLLDLDGGLDAATYGEWSGLVSEERRCGLARFHFRADAERALAGEILARAALSFVTGLAPTEFAFVQDRRGKPRAETLERPGCLLPEFNVSHAGSLVACAVSSRPIGVDVEELFLPEETLVKHVCSPGEAEYVQNGGGGLSVPAAFTLLWTLKESYLKALGVGLIDDLPGLDLASFLVGSDGPERTFAYSGHCFKAFFRRSHAVAVCEKV